METMRGVDPILRAAAYACSSVLPCLSSWFAVFDPDTKHILSLHSSNNHFPEFSGYEELAASPHFKAVETGQPVVTSAEDGKPPSVSVPLHFKQRPVGVAVIHLSSGSRETLSNAQQVLNGIAVQCGAAIEEFSFRYGPGLEDAILESLFENAPEAVVLLDQNNRVRRINGEFTRLFGYEPQEIRGKHIDTLIAPSERFQEASGYSYRAEAGEKLSAETVRMRKDGSPVEVSMLGAPIVVGGRILGIFGIYRDISDRKRVERELARSESRYREIFESAPIGIFQTHSRGYFLKLNQTAADIFGYDSVEDLLANVQDMTVDLYASPGRRGELLALMRKQGEVQNFVLDARCKDGSTVTISINARISSYEGDEFVMDGYIVDLTELKQTERRLTRSLKEKEVLLQELHHRVKNNMQIVSSLLTLEADSSAIDNEAAGKILRISQNRIRSMSLIHEKLYNSGDLTRIDLAEYTQDLCHEVFDISLIRPVPEATFDTDPVAADIDFAIPYGLILNELLLNSIKHAFKGISEPRVSISLQQTDDEVILTVRDNGTGLPADFEQQRLRSLGLQLIDSLVEQLSGSIEFSSDHGTRCRIRFPYSPGSGYE